MGGDGGLAFSRAPGGGKGHAALASIFSADEADVLVSCTTFASPWCVFGEYLQTACPTGLFPDRLGKAVSLLPSDAGELVDQILQLYAGGCTSLLGEAKMPTVQQPPKAGGWCSPLGFTGKCTTLGDWAVHHLRGLGLAYTLPRAFEAKMVRPS